jgi:amino acid transporter
VILSVGEEASLTKRKAITYSTVVLGVVAALAIGALAVLVGTFSHEHIVSSGPVILFEAADLVLPKPFGTIAILAILISSIGAIEASVIQFVKTLFAMSARGVMDVRLSRLHARRGTPWVALLLLGCFSVSVFLLSLISHTAGEVIQAAITAICFQVIFYYGITALACAWTYRQHWRHLPTLMFAILWPVCSAIVLGIVAWMSAIHFSPLANVLGLGSIVGGILYAILFVK